MKKDYSKEVFKELQEVLAKVEQQEEEIRELKLMVAALTQENARLKEMMGKNSGNSSKPSSTDFFKKPISTREPTGREIGGQKGHKPHNAELYDDVDEVIEYKVEKCECGGKIEQLKEYAVKQLVDIEVVTKVVEHRIYEGICTCCGKCVKAACELQHKVTYGENIKSLAAMLLAEGNVSINRTKSMIYELTDKVNLSEGTIVKWQNELGRKVEPFCEKVGKELKVSEVLHKDETGIRRNKKILWLHVVSTPMKTLYFVHEKRGKDADDAMGILEDYGGTLVHDHYKPLYKFECKHAECNAHIIRYLKGVIENQKCEWAKEMLNFLVELNNRRKNSEKIDIDSAFAKYNEILQKARPIYYEGQANGEDYKLWRRMGEYAEEHLRFICDENVPFDNNQAERDLRMIKAKTKISGCFRSDAGAKAFANTKSYTSTMRKNGINIYKAIISAFNSNPLSV